MDHDGTKSVHRSLLTTTPRIAKYDDIKNRAMADRAKSSRYSRADNRLECRLDL